MLNNKQLHFIGSDKTTPKPNPNLIFKLRDIHRSFFNQINSDNKHYWVLENFPYHLYTLDWLMQMDVVLNAPGYHGYIPWFLSVGSDANGRLSAKIILFKEGRIYPPHDPCGFFYDEWEEISFHRNNSTKRYCNIRNSTLKEIEEGRQLSLTTPPPNTEFLAESAVIINPYYTPEVNDRVGSFTAFFSLQHDQPKKALKGNWQIGGPNNMYLFVGSDLLRRDMFIHPVNITTNVINNIPTPKREDETCKLRYLTGSESHFNDRQPCIEYNPNICDDSNRIRLTNSEEMRKSCGGDWDKIRLLMTYTILNMNMIDEKYDKGGKIRAVICFGIAFRNDTTLDNSMKFGNNYDYCEYDLDQKMFYNQ